jgi:hypothetical protein
MRLGMKTRREIFEAHYRCYQQAGKQEKGKILEEVAGTTGLNRDHLAHVLASYGKKQTVTGEARRARRKRGGRPSEYQEKAFVVLLIRIWEGHGRPCGTLRALLIRDIIDFLIASKEPDYGISEEYKGLLVKVSGAPIDRLLAPARKALDPCGRGFTVVSRAGTNPL